MRRMITALLATSVLASLVILAPETKHGFTVVPVAHARGGCSVATLSGNYGFTFNGEAVKRLKNGSKKAVPWVGAGLAANMHMSCW